MNKISTTSQTGIAAAALALAWMTAGCEMVNQATSMAADVAAGAGVITQDQAESTKRVGTAVTKTFQDITPEQEYYIGRTVAATVLTGYKALPNKELNAYLNEVGQAWRSFRPSRKRSAATISWRWIRTTSTLSRRQAG